MNDREQSDMYVSMLTHHEETYRRILKMIEGGNIPMAGTICKVAIGECVYERCNEHLYRADAGYDAQREDPF